MCRWFVPLRPDNLHVRRHRRKVGLVEIGVIDSIPYRDGVAVAVILHLRLKLGLGVR